MSYFEHHSTCIRISLTQSTSTWSSSFCQITDVKQYLPCQVTSPTNGNKNLNNMVDNKFTNPTMHLSYLPQRTFIINPKDILEEGRKYHMNLYSDDESCNLLDRQPVRLIQEGILTSTPLPKLNKNPKSQCEGLLTESELKSIKTLKKTGENLGMMS